MVAPHVGAWIETIYIVSFSVIFTSHPMWVRGLKQYAELLPGEKFSSHPMWVRGLKPSPQYGSAAQVRSHPMWVRGLKPYFFER